LKFLIIQKPVPNKTKRDQMLRAIQKKGRYPLGKIKKIVNKGNKSRTIMEDKK
jgi:hypothetical protein